MTTPLRVPGRPSSTALLARVLDAPELAAELRALPAAALGRLVEHVGLEDAGELVALATTEQLVELLDEDLWTNRRPGEEERFDDARFVLWLGALLEAGDALVAEHLSGFSEDFLALAFSRRVLVFPLDALRAELESGDEESDAAEKALANCLSEELDDYEVVARSVDGWDTVLAALLALDREHHDLLGRVLERCAASTSSYVDELGGLSSALSTEEMLESDALAEREQRRAAAGYVAPRDASAFLKLASGGGEAPFTEHDVLTRAHFRDLDGSRTRPAPAARQRTRWELPALLRAAGVLEPPAPSALPGPGASSEPSFARAMRRLRERNPACFAERSGELAYLANVLVAGARLGKRRVRPIEAVRAAIAICSRGLDLRSKLEAAADAAEAELLALTAHPADGLFRAGFRDIAPPFSAGAPDLSGIG